MKYELTDESVTCLGRVLRRIRAISGVRGAQVFAGTLGGYVQSEHNLSQTGLSWVGEGAYVFDSAFVHQDAHVYGNARIFGRAQIFGRAEVYGETDVHGAAQVYGNARVYGNANVGDCVKVDCNARVYGDSVIFGDAQVYGDAEACDAFVFGKSHLYGRVRVNGEVWTWGDEPAPSEADAVALLDRIRQVALLDPSPRVLLDMSAWHCNTSHCLAGWAQELTTSKPYDEEAYEAGVRALGRHAAHFFDDTDTAARWLSEREYIKE